MMPASYRVGWATRGGLARGPLVLAWAAMISALAGALFAVGTAGERLGWWCAGCITVGMIAVDFPGLGDGAWAEFELSLPLSMRDRVGARLGLTLAFWIAPLLLAFGLGAIGVVPALHGSAARIAALSATGSTVLAAVIREVPRLSERWRHRPALFRGAALLVAIIGFALPAIGLGPAMLLMAFALLWWSLARAPAALELRLPSAASWTRAATTSSASSEAPTAALALDMSQGGGSVRGLVRGYTLGSGYAIVFLVATFLWSFGLELGDGAIAHVNTLLLAQWAAYHAGWSARILRLEALPIDRERLFRYVVWPSLIAFTLGSALALALGLPSTLARVNSPSGTDTVLDARSTLQSAKGYWRLARGQAPLVEGPGGEAYRPEAHRLGLGSALIAYDPYETGPQPSHGRWVYQLGRLLHDEHGLTLTPAEIEARTKSDPGRRHVLTTDLFPELRGEQRREWLARFVVLALTLLLVLRIPIRPGPSRRGAAGSRRVLGPLPTALLAILYIGPLLAVIFSFAQVDAPRMMWRALIGGLAPYPLPALAVAAVLGIVLYRSLQRRFRQMEPPPRNKQWDNWFIEV
jgi:hypothetical protein